MARVAPLVFALVSAVGAAGAPAAFAQSASPQPAGLVVHGEVTDSTGAAVVGAQVTIARVRGPVVTASDGRFTVRGVPIGQTQIVVRRLGFRPITIEVNLVAEPVFLPIVLAAVPEALSGVTVHARSEVYDARLSGFNARKSRGLGYFITREQIEHTTSSRLIDALRGFPGVRVVMLRGALGRSVTIGGANCPPLVFLDGFPATAGPMDLDGIDLGSLEGIEVYAGSVGVPPELMGPRGPDRCGVIALWSTPARPRRSASEQQAIDVDELVSRGSVFTGDQVERRAIYVAGSAVPAYPEALSKARIRGRVVVAMVVDANGDVEPGTISVVTTTDSAFSAPAVSAAAHARFAPAQVHGKRVRQLVRLPFDFEPSGSGDRVDTGSPIEEPQ
jgi:TonB family protein